MDKSYSLADIGAMMNNRNDGFLEGNGIIILILFFLIFGFGGGAFGGGAFGGGFGNNAAMQGALTRAELYDGLNDNTVIRKLDGITNGICDGFYAQNTAINEIGSKVQTCCCETNRNIDAVRYDNSQNTCAITTNATANTQKILDKLCNMEANAKDQRIADLTSSLQTANFQLSQQAQNATLINALRPFPNPAYLTCSPYQSTQLACGMINGTFGY